MAGDEAWLWNVLVGFLLYYFYALRARTSMYLDSLTAGLNLEMSKCRFV